MASLAKQFANHTIERAYNAVVWGAPRMTEGVIEGQIGRSPFDRKRMAVLRGGGKLARTRYRLLERFGPDARPLASLIECRPGDRPHPPDSRPPRPSGTSLDRRSHLWPAPARPLGQRPPAEEVAFAAAGRLSPVRALHAFVLGFQHPSLHKTMRFESPWPGDFAGLVEALRGLD